jgi:hypothetical protein
MWFNEKHFQSMVRTIGRFRSRMSMVTILQFRGPGDEPLVEGAGAAQLAVDVNMRTPAFQADFSRGNRPSLSVEQQSYVA